MGKSYYVSSGAKAGGEIKSHDLPTGWNRQEISLGDEPTGEVEQLEPAGCRTR